MDVLLGRQRHVNESVHRTATIKFNSARNRRWRVSFVDFDLSMLTADVSP